jgi:hypothetical protein
MAARPFSTSSHWRLDPSSLFIIITISETFPAYAETMFTMEIEGNTAIQRAIKKAPQV